MTRWTKFYDEDANESPYLQQKALQNEEEKKKMLLDKAFKEGF